MRFAQDERNKLLAVKGVGPKVIERLEQMGLSSLSQLADADPNDILAQGASLTGSSCWKNSPQAKAAVQGAIGAALAHTDSPSLLRKVPRMAKINLSHEARQLPVAWRSKVIGKAAGANFKVLRMDGASYPSEVHDFVEALLVVDGQMNLEIGGQTVAVGAGEVFMVPVGQPHAVAPGSHGTLVIIDP